MNMPNADNDIQKATGESALFQLVLANSWNSSEMVYLVTNHRNPVKSDRPTAVTRRPTALQTAVVGNNTNWRECLTNPRAIPVIGVLAPNDSDGLYSRRSLLVS